MGTAKNLKFDTTFKNEVRLKFGLTNNEYLVALFILAQVANPANEISGWCAISKKQIAAYFSLSERQVFYILKSLWTKKLIEKYVNKLNQSLPLIRVSKKFYDCQICIPTAKFADPLQKLQTFSKEIPPTPPKENIIPSPNGEGRVLKKKPSCPLLNGSPLSTLFVKKYPNGHKECVQYLLSCEELRKHKFINRPKQFLTLHKIIKAGFDFTEIDRVMRRVDKKYGDNNWDFATLANWLEKGGASAEYT